MNQASFWGASKYTPYTETAEALDSQLIRDMVRQVCGYISNRYTVGGQSASWASRTTSAGYSMSVKLETMMSRVQGQYQSHRNGYNPTTEMLEAVETLTQRGVFKVDGDHVSILV